MAERRFDGHFGEGLALTPGAGLGHHTAPIPPASLFVSTVLPGRSHPGIRPAGRGGAWRPASATIRDAFRRRLPFEQ